ncbi:hypothetical protein BJ878DRAFT_266030 [Calycina marina]|uniref:Uncharacterized protein n=1 Tax=Calycina marina TaxID=1763456 RepID=A0A9P8CJC8_9HELO|nr:hypothetical protein BJ878DRAFT_266030 [Calycina marina]
MADTLPQPTPSGMERGRHRSSSRLRSDGDRPSSRASQHRVEEGCHPPVLPKAFSGMLKTTTETGDIGMFSIKPSRVPHPPGSPRKVNGFYRDAGQQLRNIPRYDSPGIIDDRRRLPSYSRDAASEVISMYETASQKSTNRRYDDPEYRSYSMNQTYFQYALTNQRSYSSLRSHPDGGNQLQRPRSPFAYPARLRRPGFRPSSPALTDGGLVDYSRRTEIERGSHVARTSSPASMYTSAHRRPYGPATLRSNANRSTHSLLSQSSPPRRSISPLPQPDDGTPSSEWLRRHGPTSRNSSPARSTFSFASTANLCQPPAASTTTTPGKPSPLYYDYTEDFDIDDYNRPVSLEPPPTFRVDKTIPEDRPLSSPSWQNGSDDGTFQANSRSSPRKIPAAHRDTNGNNTGGEPKSPRLELESLTDTASDDALNGTVVRGKQVVRLSGQGFGAQEPSRGVGETFGIPTNPSFEINTAAVNEDNKGDFGNDSSLMETASMRTSGYSFNTHLKKFPPPPGASKTSGTLKENNYPRQSSDTMDGRARENFNSHNLPSPTSPEQARVDGAADHAFENPLATPKNLKRPSQQLRTGNGNDAENERPAIKINSSEVSRSNTQSPTVSQAQFNTPKARGSLPTGLSPKKDIVETPSKPTSSLVHRPSKKRRMEATTEPLFRSVEVPNFSHQIPRRLATRSESPMLAPKPISPARQLKLKNSVPQLMKALPAVPHQSEKAPRAVSPLGRLATSGIRDQAAESLPALHSGNASISPISQVFSVGPSTGGSNLITSIPAVIEDETDDAFQPRKRKLKLRASVSARPISADSRPWNREDSYPWSEADDDNEPLFTPNRGEEPTGTTQPKFKFNVIRASNSTMGTILVNRDCNDPRPNGGIMLKSPKDLFTAATGFDGMFSSITRHLHGGKENADSEGRADHGLVEQSDRRNIGGTVLSGSNLNPTTSSISHDSEHSFERLNLRKRISNLRSRVAGPYLSRQAAQSYDDMTWRSLNREGAPSPSPARSHPNLHVPEPHTEPERRRTAAGRAQVHHIRVRLSEWFRGAKLAISSHVRRSGQQ